MRKLIGRIIAWFLAPVNEELASESFQAMLDSIDWKKRICTD
jgi:hypothetical protein